MLAKSGCPQAASDDDTVTVAAVWAISGEQLATVWARPSDTVQSLRQSLQSKAGCSGMSLQLLLDSKSLNDSDALSEVGLDATSVLSIQVLALAGPHAGVYRSQANTARWDLTSWLLELKDDGTCRGDISWSSVDFCGHMFRADGVWAFAGATVTLAWRDPSADVCGHDGANYFAPRGEFDTAAWDPETQSLDWGGSTLTIK
eukprot:gnl/TRDRNA2_/TRDRNA2_150119_c0_seq1.p1 gnl/TRDRNA2_/TRDRNA2_150119_c0~~gnl/TRDRNA2_/TRDRNA2_150119_c0_seq1.p1  ORF type:complete len:202 (-),score=29.38 gnl/TRDRNA2_/TRDRNA2_150119_c0_seq1:138-743(-)